MKTIQSSLMLLGRLCISVIFFYAAFHKITHWDTVVHEMAMRGIPQTSIFLFFACFLEFVGGVFLVLGFKVRWASAFLVLLLIPVCWLFLCSPHDYMNPIIDLEKDPNFSLLKNTAIVGGLLYIMAVGAGNLSLDRE